MIVARCAKQKDDKEEIPMKQLSPEIMQCIENMGCPGTDRVTGFKGIIDSVCIDLYGCIQYSLKPSGVDEKGEPYKGFWFDTSRVEIKGKPVMEVPKHFFVEQSSNTAPPKQATTQGPADKPQRIEKPQP